MKLQLMAVLLSLAPVSFAQQGSQSYFTGTAINTTDAGNPVAAPVRISLTGNDCKLTVSAPLLGSGNCVIKTFDQKSGHLEIVSYGPPAITWTGTLKGNFASGTYQISIGSQTGSFYLALLSEAEAVPRVVPPANPYSAPLRSSCVPAVESSISGSVEGWKGETIFKLSNGQIWQQAEYDYNYFYAYSPDVTIYQTTAGCRMKVEDEDETVLVKRIK